MVQLNMKQVITVIGVILAVLLGIVGLFVSKLIGGGIVGVTANELTNADTLNVSAAMSTHLTGVETDYISFADTTTGKVGLTLGIFAVVIIMGLFGFKFKSGMGGSGKGPQ